MSFWIGNVLVPVLNIPLIGIWVRILTIPYQVLFPAILFFVCIGTYSVANRTFDVFLVLVLSVFARQTISAAFLAVSALFVFYATWSARCRRSGRRSAC